jgi:hypothetical protein
LFTLPAINSLESLKQGISLPSTLPAEKSVLSDRLLGLRNVQVLQELGPDSPAQQKELAIGVP